MTHRPPTFSSSPCNDGREKSFSDALESLQTCCAQARDAARDGRYSIAHDLFQDALTFFERAYEGGDICYGASEFYLWPRAYRLDRARRQLDECAALIYTDQIASESRAWPALAEGNLP